MNKIFPPEQAERLRRDLALVEFLASAPEAQEYDYWSVLQNYVTKIQQLASRAHLFLSHGTPIIGKMKTLELKKTSQVLLTHEAARQALGPDGPDFIASPKSVVVLLTDQTESTPLIVLIEGLFGQEPGGYSPSPEPDGETFRLEMGQAPNWLRFVPIQIVPPRSRMHNFRFQEVEYRLSAADLKAIVEALIGDLHDYIQKSKSDQEILRNIRMELTDFMKIG